MHRQIEKRATPAATAVSLKGPGCRRPRALEMAARVFKRLTANPSARPAIAARAAPGRSHLLARPAFIATPHPARIEATGTRLPILKAPPERERYRIAHPPDLHVVELG